MTKYVKLAASKLFSKYKFKSILFKNFLKIFVLITILLSILSVYIYNSLVNINKDEILSGYRSNAERISESINNTLSEIKKIAVTMAMDQNISLYITSDNYEKIKPDIYSVLDGKITSYKNIISSIHSIYIYRKKSDTVFSGAGEKDEKDFERSAWVEEYKLKKNDGLIVVPRRMNSTYPYVISYICDVQGIGCVVVNVDIFILSKNNELGSEDVTMYMLDNNNTVVYSNKEKLFLSQFDNQALEKIQKNDKSTVKLNGNTYAGYIGSSSVDGWKTVVLTSTSNYNDRIQLTKIILIISLILMLGIIISLGMALNVYEPVSNIVKIIDSSGKDKSLIPTGDNEVGYIASRIIQIVDDNNDLKEELDKRMQQYHNLQLMTLQSQINPHFLNNTLNVIGLKLIKEAGMESESLDMLTTLTRLVQYTFRNGQIQTPFSTEIEFVKIYIELLKKRYKNLSVEWDICENAYKYKILCFCMQPILENAVFHGVGGMRINGTIKIKINEDENHIVINITDNGQGMSEEQLRDLKKDFNNDMIDNIHVGVKNVYRRIKLVYNENGDMEVESEKGKYTSVMMYIPKIPIDSQENHNQV